MDRICSSDSAYVVISRKQHRGGLVHSSESAYQLSWPCCVMRINGMRVPCGNVGNGDSCKGNAMPTAARYKFACECCPNLATHSYGTSYNKCYIEKSSMADFLKLEFIYRPSILFFSWMVSSALDETLRQIRIKCFRPQSNIQS